MCILNLDPYFFCSKLMKDVSCHNLPLCDSTISYDNRNVAPTLVTLKSNDKNPEKLKKRKKERHKERENYLSF